MMSLLFWRVPQLCPFRDYRHGSICNRLTVSWLFSSLGLSSEAIDIVVGTWFGCSGFLCLTWNATRLLPEMSVIIYSIILNTCHFKKNEQGPVRWLSRKGTCQPAGPPQFNPGDPQDRREGVHRLSFDLQMYTEVHTHACTHTYKY